VTSVPDTEGEQLCVVHGVSVPEGRSSPRAAASDLRDSSCRASHFVEVAALPRTGTGKTDLAGLKRLAERALAGASDPQ
jgi:hypothetical protein